jgi:hypothetical protein
MIGKVKYIGKSFGIESLTNGKTYDVLAIEKPFIRIIDDCGEDYLYNIYQPGDLQNIKLFGRWELIESNDKELSNIFINDSKNY